MMYDEATCGKVTIKASDLLVSYMLCSNELFVDWILEINCWPKAFPLNILLVHSDLHAKVIQCLHVLISQCCGCKNATS